MSSMLLSFSFTPAILSYHHQNHPYPFYPNFFHPPRMIFPASYPIPSSPLLIFLKTHFSHFLYITCHITHLHQTSPIHLVYSYSYSFWLSSNVTSSKAFSKLMPLYPHSTWPLFCLRFQTTVLLLLLFAYMFFPN